jgi:hypothetical protein
MRSNAPERFIMLRPKKDLSYFFPNTLNHQQLENKHYAWYTFVSISPPVTTGQVTDTHLISENASGKLRLQGDRSNVKFIHLSS